MRFKPKLPPAVLIAILSCLCAARAVAAETHRYLVIKIENHDDSISYDVLTKTEYTALRDEIQLEHRFHGRALQQAKDLWRKSPNGKRSFPTQGIHRRNASVEGSADMDIERAAEKKAELISRLESKKGFSELREADSLTESRRTEQRRVRHAFSSNIYEDKQDALEATARVIFLQELNALIEAGKPAEEETAPQAPAEK